jgi:type IV pilus assembly protein PilM
MLSSLIPRNVNLVGLDIGTCSIKMVQVRQASPKPKLVNMGIAPVPRDAFAEGRIAKPEIIANIIRQLANHLKIRQKTVAVSVSGYDVMIKKIELPTMTEQELEAKMYADLGQYIPYNVDEVDIDYQVMDVSKERPNFMEVLLVAAKKESITDLNGLLKLAGFDPYVVDVDFFALGNAFEATHGFEDDSIALLDMGANKSVMNISHKGVPIFTRGVSIGGNQITESIKDYFRITFEEAEGVKLGEAAETYQAQALEDIFVSTAGSWVNECKRALDFYYHNYPDNTVKALYISGGSCRLPGFEKVLQEHLEIPVEIFNPIAKLQYDSKQFDPAYIEYIGPQMAISLGLALRKTKEK